MKRNLNILLSLVVLASLILAACGGATATEAPTEEPAAPATEPPAATEEPATPEEKIAAAPQPWRGITVRDIPDELAKQLRLPGNSGVMIVDIRKNSPDQASGLRKGDVIIAINKKPVHNAQDFNEAIKDVKGGVLVRTLRGYFVLEP